MLEELDYLEENNVFIHYSYDHYNNGTNCNFSIEFRNKNVSTGWYGDNHEYGNVRQVMIFSIKLAIWYLDNPKFIDLINSGYHNEAYSEYNKAIHEFTEQFTTTNEAYNHYRELFDSKNKISEKLTKVEFLDKCIKDLDFAKECGMKFQEEILPLERRYNIWFNNNYETGMERYFDPNKLPDFNDPYYEPTPSKSIKILYNNNIIAFTYE